MPIRITCDSTEGAPSLRIEGRLLSGDLAALREECERHPGPIRLELADLQFADRESAQELRRLLRERAELRSAHPYLELLLHATGREDARTPGDTGGGSAES